MPSLSTFTAVEVRQSDRERTGLRPPRTVRRGDTLSERHVVSWSLIDPSPRAVPEPWLRTALSEVRRLLEMPAGWDSYGAPPIDPEVAARVMDVLGVLAREHAPEPDVVPLSSGGLQLEWYTRALEVQLDLEPGTETFWLSYRDDSAADAPEWEGPLGREPQGFDALLGRLSAPD